VPPHLLTRAAAGALGLGLAVALLAAPEAPTPAATAPPITSATGASGPRPRPPSSDKLRTNKLVVRRYLIDVLSHQELGALDALVTKDFIDRTPEASSARGPGSVRATQQKIHEMFSKVDYHIEDLVAEDDRVVARYVVEATPRLRDSTQPPRAVVINGVTIFHLVGGKIADLWIMNDQLAMLRQLGFVVSAPASSPPANNAAPPHPR
jgi:predicted ester cyclase